MTNELDYDKILVYLDGFILTSDFDEEDFPADLEYNKILNPNEIKEFYEVATSNAKSYLDLNANNDISHELLPFIYMWTAGLIYKKYDIRPNDLVDETYPVGYGDQLIISAKTGLKPYKTYEFNIF